MEKPEKHDEDCDCIECVPRDLVEPFDDILIVEKEYGFVVGVVFKRGINRWLIKLDRTDAAKLGKKLERYVK